jgi:HSP20 family protein
MTSLIRWDPAREMTQLRQMMDRMFDESWFDAPARWTRQEGFPLALDLLEDTDAYTVKASIPGIQPDDVEITLTDNVLTIKGETRGEQNVEEKNYHLRERHFGSFTRSIRLPMPVDADQVDASHENGVLTLHLPKLEAVKPKRIAVKTTVNGQ